MEALAKANAIEPRRKISLVPVIDLDTESQLLIREIRNDPSIRQAMYTDHEITVNEHLQWINRLKHDSRQIVFAVIDPSHGPLGMASVNAIDMLHKKADWAFYLSQSGRGGLGSAIEWNMINFVFDTMGLEKLNCEVIEGNDAVVKLHKKFGFEEEGFRKENIIKSGKRIGVHFLGLSKFAWARHKDLVEKQYQSIFDRFEIKFILPAEKEPNPLDQIESARAKNNLNWMSILRIALEKSPTNATQIVAEIKRLDQEISGLTQKLLG